VIRLNRSAKEPTDLKTVRKTELKRIQGIASGRQPTSDEIGHEYKKVAADLWRTQDYKCAYCEIKLEKGYNDVEHYRPKAEADRRPGSHETYGYHWLAFTWSNLYFSCPTCNRSYKRIRFPLDNGSVALKKGEKPPGKEVPLLIDPAVDNGVEFIEFVYARLTPSGVRANDKPPRWHSTKHWFPRPRGGDARGKHTIEICGLDDWDRIEIYDDHVTKEVVPVVDDLKKAIATNGTIQGAFERGMRLLQRRKAYVGLSYDALVALVPAKDLARFGLRWPAPKEVGRI